MYPFLSFLRLAVFGRFLEVLFRENLLRHHNFRHSCDFEGPICVSGQTERLQVPGVYFENESQGFNSPNTFFTGRTQVIEFNNTSIQDGVFYDSELACPFFIAAPGAEIHLNPICSAFVK